MLRQHRSHVFSTCSTALHHLEEIRQAVTLGKSPSGAHLAPLPEPGRRRLLDALDSVRAALDDIMQSFAPGETAVSAGAAGHSATMMWVNILLRTVEELVSDLAPARMGRRYGALPRAEAQRLQSEVEKAIAIVRQAMEVSDSVSSG